MAWTDFPALVAGSSPPQLSHFNDIRLALIERCEWVGDSTQKANAVALSTTTPKQASWLNSCRSIIEAILGKYENPATVNTTTGEWAAWSKQTLMTKIFGDHAESSGVAQSGGTYNWILRPTRIVPPGTLLLGATMAAATYSPWLEHIMGLYYMIDELRWIELRNYQTASPYWKTYRKLGTSQSTPQAAWNAMLGYSPVFYANEWFNGINALEGGPTSYRYQVFRGVFRWKYSNAPLAGFYPSGFADGKISYAIPNGFTYKFKGPWKVIGNTAADAIGATNWASGTEMVALTINTINIYEAFDLADASLLPTSGSAWYLRIQHGKDNDVTVPTTVNELNDQPNAGTIIAKPTTVYGS